MKSYRHLKIFAALYYGGWSLVGCAPASGQSFAVDRDQATVFFTGPLSEANARSLEIEISRAKTSKLVITSAGGDAIAAMKVADLILREDIAVEVRKFCNSACAQYIALSTSKLTIDPQSILIFHHSMHSMSNLVSSATGSISVPAYLEAVQMEERLYQKIGLNRLALSMSISAMRPKCVLVDAHLQPSDPRKYGVLSKEVGFQPSPRFFKSIGYIFEVKGLATSQMELDGTIGALPFNSSFRPVILDSVSADKDRGDRLPLCG